MLCCDHAGMKIYRNIPVDLNYTAEIYVHVYNFPIHVG